MSIFDAMLAPIYALVSDTTVTRADGSSFSAILDDPDVDSLDVRIGSHTLRAARAVGLVEGESVVIAGRAYTVLAEPKAILDGREVLAQLGDA